MYGTNTGTWGLNAGASDSGTTTVTVPGNLSPGTYYIGAIADATHDVTETDESNNALAGATISVVKNVDLVMTALTKTATIVARGGSFTISDTEKNMGTDKAIPNTGNWNMVFYYLSTDTNITPADKLIGYRLVYGTKTGAYWGVNGGASDSASTVVTVPANTPVGTYYIGAIADSGHVVTETNENNNAKYGATISVH